MITADDFSIKEEYDYGDIPSVLITIPSELSDHNRVVFNIYTHGILIYFNKEIIILHYPSCSNIHFLFKEDTRFCEIEFYSHFDTKIKVIGLKCFMVDFLRTDANLTATFHQCDIEHLTSDTKLNKLAVYNTSIHYLMGVNTLRMIIDGVNIKYLVNCRIHALRVYISDIILVRHCFIESYSGDDQVFFGAVCNINLADNQNSNLEIKQGDKHILLKDIKFNNDIINYFVAITI